MTEALSEPELTCIQTCVHHFPSLQAIYLFGSWRTSDEKPRSDEDGRFLHYP
ncbi:MAG: hypothetical protein Q9M28_00295 [Mariprofundaceae bacterium]|nr:hypothetical protein [Mariprofundaceae bacterium]